MTKQEIIEKFRLYYDDGTSLSTQEESDLFDKIYDGVCSDRPWEILRKTGTGTTSTSVPYIALPDDFQYLSNNANYSTSDYEAASGPVVFVGDDYEPYPVVSFADRRQYRTDTNKCYIDIVNSRLYFTVQPTSAQVVEFDYIHQPAPLGYSDTPIFPDRFLDVIYHGMVVDQNVIEMSDKAKSYAPENKKMYDDIIKDMAYWNSRLIQM
jgi:hypothetical protein